MHILLGPSLLKEMANKGFSIEIRDDTLTIGGDVIDLAEPNNDEVEEAKPRDQLSEEEEEEPGIAHHLEIRLGKGFEFPICDEEDLLAIRQEFEETAQGYTRAVVIGDICGEVCYALAENTPGATVYSVGLHKFDGEMPTNVKSILQEPKQAARELDYQAINALYVISDALDFERSLASWMKHLTNGGKLFIIDPETSPQTASFKRDSFSCISSNVYMRTFRKDDDVNASM